MSDTSSIPRRYLHLRGAADTSAIRKAWFMGREHVVVPVVALVGGAVVRPMGSKGPEYVPPEELSLVPGAWNSRPVVPDHPTDSDGNPVSAAESPETLAANQFGLVFDSRYEDGRLKMSAYIDPARASELGGDALSALTRAQAGEDVEVSVGAWVYADEESGTSPGGKKYEYVWREIVPDHLAMLPEGVTGACSVEMGCGAPRVARQKDQSMPKKKTRELRAAKIEFAAAITDREMRDWLEAELADAEPDAQWIYVRAIDQDEGFVVYKMSTDEESERMYRRSFSVSGDELLLSPERSEVREKIEYVPASSDTSENTSDMVYNTSEGGTKLSVVESETTAPTCKCQEKESPMADNTENAVDRLIASSASPFTDEFREDLKAMSEEKLKTLSNRYLSEDADEPEETEPVAAKEEAKSEPEPAKEPDADVVQLSREEYEDIRAAAHAHKEAQAKRKSDLVASIRSAQEVYSEEQLQAKDLEDLEALSALCEMGKKRAVDFTGRGLSPDPSTPAYDRRALPDTYGLDAKGN